MPLIINDEELATVGLTAEQARVELACGLFQAGRLALWPAAKLAGLSRVQMEEELVERKIPVYVITSEDFQHDLEVLNRRTVSP